MYKLIVFDLDGTLVDTSEASHRAFLEACRQLGVKGESRWKAYRAKTGLPPKKMLDAAVPEIADRTDEYVKYYSQAYDKAMAEVKCYEGVKDTLRQIKIPKALLTSRIWLLTSIIVKDVLGEELDYVLTPELTQVHKPDPEPLLKICAKFGVKASETLFVGDSPHDIRCGKAAGAKTAWASWGFYGYDTVKEIGPDYKLDCAHDLLGLLDITLG